MRRRNVLLVLTLVGGLLLGSLGPMVRGARAAGGSWSPAGDMGGAREFHAATRLADGGVLIVGGSDGGNDLSTAERYDPASGAWSSAGAMSDGYGGYQTATTLGDGTVLVAVGYNRPGGFLTKAERYDPASNTWTPTGALNTGRQDASATLLPNGQVLVAGGYNGTRLRSSELYDPATGTWTPTGDLITGRSEHRAVLLNTGQVLVVGGIGNDGTVATAELYDPATGNWRATGTPRDLHQNYFTASLLANGQVLVAGGYSGTLQSNSVGTAKAEVYDPATGAWSATGALTTERVGAVAARLADGRVLVAGGAISVTSTKLASAELYDPAAGTWTATGALATARAVATATALTDGRVLVAGGYNNDGALAGAELYTAPGGTPAPSPSPAPGGARFADVPAGYWAHDQIGAFAQQGITTGCDVGLYCPERGVTRAEMAVFLDRTLGQGQLTPATPTFADVPAGYWAYGYIERLAALGVTTGCGTNSQGQRLYCPDRGVSRAEMATFIDRALGQAQAAPATPTFADVPASYPAYGYIEAFFGRGVTTGCGTDDRGRRLYCPDRGVTRAEMAVFIIRAFP